METKKVRFSIIPQVSRALSAGKELPWDALAEALCTPREGTAKEDIPLWSPATFRSPTGREIADVVDISCAVVDLDHCTQKDIQGSIDLLRSKGLAFVIYSTWNNVSGANPSPRYRLVLPFDRPQWPSDWPKIWARLALWFPYLDTQCKDASRCYYWHSGPAEHRRARSYQGAFLRVDMLPPLPSTKSALGGDPGADLADPNAVVDITDAMIEAFGNNLLRSKKDSAAVLGDRLIKLARGHAIAQEGEGDTWIFKLTGAIVRRWPTCNPETTAQLFQRSLSHGVTTGQCEDAYPIHKIVQKILRHKATLEAAASAKEALSISEEQRQIALAFESTDRGRMHPYTPEEIEALCPGEANPVEYMQRRWILQHGKTYYVLTPRGYEMCQGEALRTKCLVDLSPAISCGVELYKVTEKGKIPLTAAEMVAKYGREIGEVRMSLLPGETRYVPETRRLSIKTAPLKKIDPKYDPEIQEWLEKLGGLYAKELLAWLAWSTDLSRPCAALFLWGAGNLGKSLLACGVSALWGQETGTPLDAVAGDWTEDIMRCPLLVADESLPCNGKKGGMDLAWFRQLIQAREHTLKIKHVSNAKIEGAVRVLIVAQKMEVLYTGDHLNADDAAAIAERIAVIPGQREASEVLRRQTPETLSYWAREGIAAHILTLKKPEANGRFIVKIDSRSQQRTVASRSTLGRSVVQWIALNLIHNGKEELKFLDGLIVVDGKIYVRAALISETWNSFFPGEIRPKVSAVSEVLEAMSTGRRIWKSRRLHEIDPNPIIAWAEQTGEFVDMEKRIASVSVPSRGLPTRSG